MSTGALAEDDKRRHLRSARARIIAYDYFLFLSAKPPDWT